MSASYIVRYEGECTDPDAFRAYYAREHAQLLKQFPGIQALTLFTPAQSNDPFAVNAGDAFFMAQMTFRDIGSLDFALRSEARAHARDDADNFPRFKGLVEHQAMIRNDIF